MYTARRLCSIRRCSQLDVWWQEAGGSYQRQGEGSLNKGKYKKKEIVGNKNNQIKHRKQGTRETSKEGNTKKDIIRHVKEVYGWRLLVMEKLSRTTVVKCVTWEKRNNKQTVMTYMEENMMYMAFISYAKMKKKWTKLT